MMDAVPARTPCASHTVSPHDDCNQPPAEAYCCSVRRCDPGCIWMQWPGLQRVPRGLAAASELIYYTLADRTRTPRALPYCVEILRSPDASTAATSRMRFRRLRRTVIGVDEAP